MMPDVDLLFGTHSTYTHSVGAVLIVLLVAGAWGMSCPGSGPRRAWRVAATAGAAYASHLLLDWLGTDTSPPFGIMALWPFSDAFCKAPVSWFLPVSRDVWSREFWTGTTLAVVTELVIFGPLVWAVHRLRGSRFTLS